MKLLPTARMYLLTLLILPFWVSCNHEPELDPSLPEVCFENEVLPVIQSGCTMSGCHNGNNSELPPLMSYENISKLVNAGNPMKSKLHKVLIATPGSEQAMPPKPRDPLSKSQIDMISLWILQGAKNTTCQNSDCDTSNVTFVGTILPITDTYCKGCHSGTHPSGGISLTDYATIKNSVESQRFMGAIEQLNGYSPMPQGGNKLSDCAIRQLKIWINNGMPNN